jgi:hypothetical protein
MPLGTALILIAVGYMAFFHTRRFFNALGVLVALLALGGAALYVNEVYVERPKREAQERVEAQQRAAQEQAERVADAYQSSRCDGEHRVSSWTDHTGQSYRCPWFIKEQQEQEAEQQAARERAAKEVREQAAKARSDLVPTALGWCDGWHGGEARVMAVHTRAQCAECLLDRWDAEPLKDTYTTVEAARDWWRSGQSLCQ